MKSDKHFLEVREIIVCECSLPVEVDGAGAGMATGMHGSHTPRLVVVVLGAVAGVVDHFGEVAAVQKRHRLARGSTMRAALERCASAGGLRRVHHAFHPRRLGLDKTQTGPRHNVWFQMGFTIFSKKVLISVSFV